MLSAVNRPRVHFERNRLSAEGGFPPETLAQLEPHADETHVWPATNLFFGGVHVVEQHDTVFAAAGDGRRGGVGRIV